MARIETRGKRADYRPTTSDLGFLVGMAIMTIMAIGLIALSVAVGVGVAPDISMFAAP
jgi:hypothetical protein